MIRLPWRRRPCAVLQMVPDPEPDETTEDEDEDTQDGDSGWVPCRTVMCPEGCWLILHPDDKTSDVEIIAKHRWEDHRHDEPEDDDDVFITSTDGATSPSGSML